MSGKLPFFFVFPKPGISYKVKKYPPQPDTPPVAGCPGSIFLSDARRSSQRFFILQDALSYKIKKYPAQPDTPPAAGCLWQHFPL